MADFDAQLPVRAIATQFTTEVANASGSTINPVEEFAQASTTSGQSGSLIQAAVTTAAPTYTTGTTDPLSLTTAGALRVDGSATTQPVSGTVAATQSGTWTVQPGNTANTTPWLVTVSTALPTGGNVIGAVTQSGGPWTVNETQIGGSSYTLGQKTMANSAPVVIASDQSAIPVTFSSSTVEKTDYKTVAALASNATDTHNYTPAGTDLFDGFEASASGALKVELKIGPTGSETSRGVWFSSSSSRYISFRLPNPISVPNTSSVKLLVTNFDKQAMDVYSTILTH